MTDHLPALVVVVPLMSAPLCVLLRHAGLAWAIALVASAATFAMAVIMVGQTFGGEPLRYFMGGWPPPWGIEFRLDTLGSVLLLLISGTATLVAVYARASVAQEIDRESHALFYAAYLLCLTGLLGIAMTGDAFNLFVFLEISSIATYALISTASDRRALWAAFQYLIMGTVGASFILIGIAALYVVSGTLNMTDLARFMPQLADARIVRMGFAFLVIGASIKLALFPLHLWLPNAYTHAPSAVSAFIAATASKVAAYVLLRFFYTVFGADFSFNVMPLGEVLMMLSLAAAVWGSIMAIVQTDVKRLLAYSSVAQVGYIMLGVSINNEQGLAAAIVHLFNHGMMKGALFMAVGCVVYRTASSAFSDFAGIGRRMPWTFSAAAIAGASLVGVPMTAGFISKWNLLQAALSAGLWPVAVIIVFSSLLAVVYVWRVVEAGFFRAPGPKAAQATEAPLSMLAPLWLLALANLYFGIQTDLTWGLAMQAAIQLLAGT